MARPKEFDPAEALDRAMALFWRKGYFDTSMRDIVAETGVSHAGLYSTFGNKHELFLAALDLYHEQIKGEMMCRLETPDAALPEVIGYFEGLVNMTKDPRFESGCMICNAAIDLAPEDPAVSARVQGYLDRIIAAFRGALERAVEKGQVRKDLDPQAAADVLGSTLVAIGSFQRAGMSEERLERFVSNALATLR